MRLASRVRLDSERPGGQREQFDAVGGNAVSSLVEKCLEQWRRARELPGQIVLAPGTRDEWLELGRFLAADPRPDADVGAVSASLRITALLALEPSSSQAFARVLELDPNHLRARWEARPTDPEAPETLEALRRFAAEAPCFWEPWAALAALRSVRA